MKASPKTMKASPKKLRDGSWGARVQGTVTTGDTITITTRSGKSWDARVTRVVWTGDDMSICATESLDKARGRAPSRRRSTHGGGCHTDDNCSSMCAHDDSCPCWDGGWFNCC